ncbi:MAG: CRISPR-associated protein Cas4 [Candidatus Brocadiaceae bacterium]|nr:CRISPR-associated protein Cas4 [Candidatus Brocadiaceae bacterium]
MHDEDDLLPISALQHLAFCERQWALIHLEGLWDENVLTAEGSRMHNRSDRAEREMRDGVLIVRALRLRSLRLGLAGRADVVEFRPCSHDLGSGLPGVAGVWRAFPVEHKRGRPKRNACDRIQLCAQALCLEEMLGVPVPEGALFYGARRRRLDVSFDGDIRRQTEELAARLHCLTESGRTPPPHQTKACDNCSLMHICMPKVTGGRSARVYLNAALTEEETPES